MVFVIGLFVGVVLVVGTAVAYEEYRDWKYRFARMREARERPKVPGHAYEFETRNLGEGLWYARMTNKAGEFLAEGYSSAHPMNAVGNALTHHNEKLA